MNAARIESKIAWMAAVVAALVCLSGCRQAEPPRPAAAPKAAAPAKPPKTSKPQAQQGKEGSAPAKTAQPVAQKSPWRQLHPGMEARRWKIDGQALAYVVRLDADKWSLRAALASDLPAPKDQPERKDALAPLRRAPEFVEHASTAALAINGGFFDPDLKPMGLRISQGKQRVAFRKADWGVFYTAASDGRPGLVHASDWKSAPKADFAIECGPRLVVDGAPLKLKPNLHRRSAIGHDAVGRIFIIATVDAVDLNTLASAMASPVDKGGLGLVGALNLDGGPSTQLYVRDASSWKISGLTGVADAVLAFPR